MQGGPQPGQCVAGYRLLRRLGQGALGTVFLAEHGVTGSVVALKLTRLGAASDEPAASEEFARASEVARRLVHPGIAALHAAGIEGSLAWWAMEPAPGTDLGRYTQARRLLPEPLVLHVGQRVAQALAYAHRLGVVHRDLKPANVLVDWPSHSVKLVDFGLARAADGAQTATGLILGTPAYMAPEQLAGSVPTPCSDLYALGVMLFQLLAGRLPHEAQSMGALLRQVASAPAPDLGALCPQLPREVTALVARLLQRNPAERPADGDALACELETAAKGLAGTGSMSR
jgi:serine/threonine-protein kinase